MTRKEFICTAGAFVFLESGATLAGNLAKSGTVGYVPLIFHDVLV